MKFVRVATIGLLCALLALCITSSREAYSQQNPAVTAIAEEQQQVLGFIKKINTAEVGFFARNHQYVSLQDVIRGRLFQNNSAPLAVSDGSTGVIQNYKVSLVASGDGQHYTVTAVPSKGCAVAFFSNEAAVIYRASALGCPLMGLISNGAQ